MMTTINKHRNPQRCHFSSTQKSCTFLFVPSSESKTEIWTNLNNSNGRVCQLDLDAPSIMAGEQRRKRSYQWQMDPTGYIWGRTVENGEILEQSDILWKRAVVKSCGIEWRDLDEMLFDLPLFCLTRTFFINPSHYPAYIEAPNFYVLVLNKCKKLSSPVGFSEGWVEHSRECERCSKDCPL